MTWALAKLCKLFAACNALRSSLKLLKRAAVPHPKMHVKKIEILMFWALFGLIVVFETYAEWMISWIPMYYYFKAFLLVALSFPSLRITTLVFHSYCIPIFDSMHTCLHSKKALLFATNPWQVVRDLPFSLAIALFPFLGEYSENNSLKIQSTSDTINEQNDEEIEAKEEYEEVEVSPAETSTPPAKSNRRRSLEVMREVKSVYFCIYFVPLFL